MKFFFITAFFLLFIQSYISAQYEVLFLNGKKITVGNYQISEDFNGDSIITYSFKDKTKEILTIDIFSITDENNVEKILYKKDEDLGYDLEINEMKSFVLGSFEARENFRGFGSAATGFAIGVTSVVAPFLNKSILINKFSVSLVPVLPILHTTGSAIASNSLPSDIKITEQYPDYINDSYFIDGYRQSVKSKRVKNSIFGGIGGVLVGFAILAL